MTTFFSLTAIDNLLDVLALAGCATLVFIVLRNRLQHGHFLGGGRSADGKETFAGEMALQLMSQEYQKVHDHLQRTLRRELASLGMMDGGEMPKPPDEQQAGVPRTSPAGEGRERRRRRYFRAKQMIAQGQERQAILEDCGLAACELEILQGLQQLGEASPLAAEKPEDETRLEDEAS